MLEITVTLLLQCFEICCDKPPDFRAAFRRLREMTDDEVLAAVAKSDAMSDATNPAIARDRLVRAVTDAQDAWTGVSGYGYSTTLSSTDLLVMGGDSTDGEARGVFDSAELLLSSQLYAIAGFIDRSSA